MIVFGEGNWSHTINDWDLLFAQGSTVNALKRVLLSFGEKIEKELQREGLVLNKLTTCNEMHSHWMSRFQKNQMFQ
ncbi:Uncharacterized protein DBV15_11380, partial [Temnothorax longispinosus]